jgi:hypothetical protein
MRTKGKPRYLWYGKDPHLGRVVTSPKVSLDNVSGIKDDDPPSLRFVTEGINADQTLDYDDKARLFKAFANRGVLAAFTTLDKPCRKTPTSLLGREPAPHKQDPTLILDDDSHSRHRIVIKDETTIRTDLALSAGLHADF